MSGRSSPVFGTAVILCLLSNLAMAVFWAISWHLTGAIGGLDGRALIGLRRLVEILGGAKPLGEVMVCATALGAFPTLCLFVLLPSGLLALAAERRQASLLIARCGGGIGAANLLKTVVGRPRPSVVTHWTSFSSSSFPSGHSADATIVYLLLAALAGRHLPSVASRRYVSGCAVLLAVLVGLSRVYLGVHWPTDVLGGWFVGSAWVVACLAWTPGQARRS